jgi:hypothetical protein
MKPIPIGRFQPKKVALLDDGWIPDEGLVRVSQIS